MYILIKRVIFDEVSQLLNTFCFSSIRKRIVWLLSSATNPLYGDRAECVARHKTNNKCLF